ncbi:MAG: DUF4249 family protein [Bacteroidia bacterium]
MMNKLIIYILVILACSGCRKIVETDLDIVEKPVIECFLSPQDTEIKLRLYRPRVLGVTGPLELEGLAISDAEVRIQKVGGESLNLTFDGESNEYTAAVTAQFLVHTNSYQLFINHPDYEDVRAETRIPEPVRNLRFAIDSIPAGFVNDYFGRIQWERTDSLSYHRSFIAVEGNFGVEFQFPAYSDSGNNPDYLKLEDGQVSEVAFPEVSFQEDSDPNTFGRLSLKGDSVFYKGLNIDKNYYEYHLDLRQADRADDLADPVIIFSNIENGYGIFCSYAIEEGKTTL